MLKTRSFFTLAAALALSACGEAPQSSRSVNRGPAAAADDVSLPAPDASDQGEMDAVPDQAEAIRQILASAGNNPDGTFCGAYVASEPPLHDILYAKFRGLTHNGDSPANLSIDNVSTNATCEISLTPAQVRKAFEDQIAAMSEQRLLAFHGAGGPATPAAMRADLAAQFRDQLKLRVDEDFPDGKWAIGQAAQEFRYTFRRGPKGWILY